MNRPTVSVCLITYNHVAYIREAIDGVLAQEIDFPFELIIADDFSTDGTREILLEYKRNFPDKIKLILQDKNVGPHKNWTDLILSPDSKYIAYFEGDDYWIDKKKLQKQVDILEGSPGTGMVCTDYRKYFCSTGLTLRNCFRSRRYESAVAFDDYLLDMSSIGTATIMIRTSLVKEYFDEMPSAVLEGFVVGDTPLWLFAAARTRIAVLPEETAVYRIRDNSACHFRDSEDHYRFVQKGFEIADYFYNRFGREDSELLNRLNCRKYKAALFHGFRSMNHRLASESFKKMSGCRLSLKQRGAAGLMLAGSYGQLLNRAAGIILNMSKPVLHR